MFPLDLLTWLLWIPSQFCPLTPIQAYCKFLSLYIVMYTIYTICQWSLWSLLWSLAMFENKTEAKKVRFLSIVYFVVIAWFHASLFLRKVLFRFTQFGRMLPYTSLMATPSRILGCEFKSVVLKLLHSTLRDNFIPKKHSSFLNVGLALNYFMV